MPACRKLSRFERVHSYGNMKYSVNYRQKMEAKTRQKYYSEDLQRTSNLFCSRAFLMRTPKGRSEVSVLEGCPHKRRQYDDVTSTTPLTVLSGSVAKTSFTSVFKLHLNLLTHSTKSSIQHCTSQLQSKYSRRKITALKRNELQRNTECKKL